MKVLHVHYVMVVGRNRMNDNYYEIGTIGSTPIYEKVKAKKRNIGKLYTQANLDTAVAELLKELEE